MTYICFIESSTSTVPHMEPLMSSDLANAVDEARDLMRLHASAIAAHVFMGDDRLETVTPAG